MARYVLECPSCLDRFDLETYAPGTRVRCRNCLALVLIPTSTALDPATAEKLARVLSLRKLALRSLGLAGLIVAGLIAITWKSRDLDPPRPAPPRPPPSDGPKLSPFPLETGLHWTFLHPGGALEEWRVIEQTRGPGGSTQFEIQESGPAGAFRRLYREMPDGIVLVSELEGGIRCTFDPPMRVLPVPLYLEDAWTWQGTRTPAGGASQAWNLRMTASASEAVDSGVGRRTCFRVEIRGKAGPADVDETRWLCKGIGLLKRRAAGREVTLQGFEKTP